MVGPAGCVCGGIWKLDRRQKLQRFGSYADRRTRGDFHMSLAPSPLKELILACVWLDQKGEVLLGSST